MCAVAELAPPRHVAGARITSRGSSGALTRIVKAGQRHIDFC